MSYRTGEEKFGELNKEKKRMNYKAAYNTHICYNDLDRRQQIQKNAKLNWSNWQTHIKGQT